MTTAGAKTAAPAVSAVTFATAEQAAQVVLQSVRAVLKNVPTVQMMIYVADVTPASTVSVATISSVATATPVISVLITFVPAATDVPPAL